VSDDRRQTQAEALVVYHALRKQLAELEETPPPARARAMLLRALNHIPNLRAYPATDRDSHIIVEKSDRPSERVRLNVQDAIDSLQVVFRDFLELSGQSAGRDSDADSRRGREDDEPFR